MEMKLIKAVTLLSIVIAVTQALTLTNPIPQLFIPRCGYLRYKIPENTFNDPIQGNTRGLELSLRTATGGALPQSDDFIAFSSMNQTLTAVLTDERLKDAKLPKHFSYRLVAKTRRGTTAFAILQLTLKEAWRNKTISFLINFVWADKIRPPLPVILSIFSDKLSKYVNSDVSVLRFTHAWTPQGAYSIGVTNCSIPSGTCKNGAIEKVKVQLFNVAAFKLALLPEIMLSYAQMKLDASCVPPDAPRVLKAYPVITLSPCTSIAVKIPPDIFYDEVDENNLQLTVHAIDGKKPTAQDIWIDIHNGRNALFGAVTDKVITEQPPNGYNITIRAYNSHFLWAQTFMIVKIAKKPIQRYYQFILRLTLLGNALYPQHFEQEYIVGYINKHFKANFTNIMSYNVTGGKHLTLRCSICTLPLKCDNTTFAQTFSRMVSMTNGSLIPAFEKIFSLWYQVESVSPYVDPICQRVIHPPVPSINPWILPATNCDGLSIKIPADIFTDIEEGNVRSLKVDLYTNDGLALPKTSWVLFNSTSQVLYGRPSRDDIIKYNSLSFNKQYYHLVATDRTGANGSLHLHFVFPPLRPPRYEYQLVYSTTPFASHFQEIEVFSKKLQSYLHSTGHSGFSLQKFQAPNVAYRRIYFENCSIHFDPCDIQLVNDINSKLFSSMTPTAAFKNFMKPEFNIIVASVTNKSNCGPDANTAPRVLHPMVRWRISVCGIQKQPIPIHTFHDKEDGYTRKLTLNVTDSANRYLGLNSFVQFDSFEQVITAMASVSIAETRTAPTFLLTATDKGGLSVTTLFQASINGPLQILKNCQIQTRFEIGHSLIDKSNVYLAERIMADMTAYFGFSSSDKIGVVSIVRESTTRISFSWSYCSASYSHYTYSSITAKKTVNMVDYQGFAIVLRKVFVADTFHVHSGFKSCFRDLKVLSVLKIFSGECSKFPPVIGLNVSEVKLNVSNCGYTKISVTKDWFYDLEDGDAHHLNLKFCDSTLKQITKADNWINFDQGSKTIIISPTDRERNLGIATSKFYLTATDSSGLSTRLPLVINIVGNIMQDPRFQITFQLLNNHTVSYLNDSVYLSDRISAVHALPSGRDVMVRSFHEGNGYVDSATFTWSLCHQSVCSSNVLKRAREHLGSESHFNSLKAQFLPKLILQRATISHTCGGSTSPPSTAVNSITFNITMCGVAVFTLPPSLFSDVTDEATKNMKIHLLDSNNNHVSASSWIQLNTATLQLYAVPSLEAKLFQATNTFRLQATNSQNQSTEVLLNASVSEQPYTGSCSVTIVVERKFGTERTVDLKVLHKLLQSISNYYHDTEIKIKVLKFSKLSTFTYSLTYSNCSLTFPTKEESYKGYDESFRFHTLRPIMTRIITRNGLIQTTFSSFMQRLFKIVSLRVKDTCIEAPPFPSGQLEHKTYAYTCKEYRDPLPRNMFNDATDGTNLKYSIAYPSGKLLSPDDWIAFDEKRMEVYGMVTEEVKKRAPYGDNGYHYLIVATDSSGRSANISYYIPITNPLPLHIQTKFTLSFKTSFIESTPTATVLVNISRSIAKYLDGASNADDIMIYSYTPGRTLVFGRCKEKCTSTDYHTVASKLQLTVSKPQPAPGFVAALRGSFTPEQIFIDGAACLPKSNATIIVKTTCNITYPTVCGFIDYHIDNKTFADNFGRTTNDFILSMNISGKALTESNSVFSFSSASQLFYGPIVASRVQKTLIYDLIAKHPVSGSTGATSLILNLPDLDAFKLASKILCIITVQVTAAYNPAFTGGYIVRKFIDKTAAYLGISYQEIQIISYSSTKTYPIQMSISFANCKWYQWLSSANSLSYMSLYLSSRKNTMEKCFANYEQSIHYNQLFWNALSPDFQLVSVSANKWCKIEPNKPPTVNITSGQLEHKTYAYTCKEYRDPLPRNMFNDATDGTNLKYSIAYPSGKLLSPNDWIVFDEKRMEVYGMVTEEVKKRAPYGDNGYHYLIVATDSSGRSANISYYIPITNPLPLHIQTKFTLAFKTSFIESTPTGTVLVNISRSIAKYLDGASNADDIMIYSYTPGRSIVFGRCKEKCTSTDYHTVASKLQLTVSKPQPAPGLVAALRGSFTPEQIFIDGPACLPKSNATIIVKTTCNITYPTVCGFIDYHIDNKTFTDNFGRTTNDFILSMSIIGKALTESNSVFSFSSASQLFYGPIVASRVQKTLIYDLIAKHPVSGSTGATSLILDLPDLDAFKQVSKSICIITVLVTASYNPAFTGGYIVRKFIDKTAAYLGISYQEMQIISYSLSKTYPIQMSISFANCKWYQWLSSANSLSYMSLYASSRKNTMEKCFANYEQSIHYSQLFWNALSPDLQLVSVSANKWCKIEPNKPPTVNITTIIITVTPCTQFVRPIPTDCFYDEDGSTRDLLLQMYQEDGSQLTVASWMKFNQVTQTAYGTAPKNAQSSESTDRKFLLKATDQYGLSATSTVVIRFSGTAPTNEPPKIVMNNFRIMLPECGVYRAKLPAGFAVDKEDGDMKNLRVELRTMTGMKLSRDSWVQFDERTYEIYTLASKMSSGTTGMQWSYKVYISDSCGGETTGTIQFITKATQVTYYQHVFTFTSLIAKATYLDIQIKFLQLISSYFGATSSSYTVISFAKETGFENYTFKFSNCSTAKHICRKTDSYLITQQNVFTASKAGTNSFASFIKSYFRVTSYSSETHYAVDKPPSNSTSTLTDIEVTSCGGYSRDISQGIFTELETPSTLRYSMILTSGGLVTKEYPAQLISNQLQVISLGVSRILNVRIIATDRCNQSAYQDIKIRINIPSKPRGYEVTCSANVNTQNSAVYYLMHFTAMLKTYLKIPSYSVRILSYSRVRNSVNFTWTSCYFGEEKCNKTDIIYLKTTLFIANNVTNPRFIKSAKSVFNNVTLTEYDNNCNFTSPEPPTHNGSLSISVDLCRKIEFRIPITAFSDEEDGDTRSLQLSLLTENRKFISFKSWLQFNRVTQTIYGYPRFPTTTATFQRNHRYSLVASDIQGNTALMPVSASIKGSLTIHYMLTLHGTIEMANFGPNVDLEIVLIRKIGSFFSDHAINDISFERNGKSFTFSWSFCRMRTDKCDCFFIKKVQNILKNMTSFRHQMLPEFAATKVFTTMHGVCKYSAAPQLLIDKRAVHIYAGQSFSYYVENSHFYDQEDGYTQNLTLYIANKENQIVTSTHWLQVQRQYICGLVLLSERRSSEWRSSSSEYKLVARDACGKETMDRFTVDMNSYQIILYYKIRVYVTNSYTNVRGNCSKMQTFAYHVSKYLSINRTDIYIENIYVHSSFSNYTQTKNNYTVIVWGVRNFTLKNCKNEAVRSFREKFVYSNGSINSGFYQYMRNDFNVIKVDDDNSTCVNATFIPLVFIKVGFDFLFWILILLLILAILLLLCWCCWVFIPRCCPGCCAGCLENCCGCCGSLCGKCCMPGGKYASLEEAALAPEVESGVLSNARTAPEENATKLGKEAEPDEPEAGVLANPLPDSSGYDSASKVDEEEMKIDQRAANTDYYATPEYLQKADDLGGAMDEESSGGTDEAFSDSTFVPSLHSATAPLPMNIESGVAAMPHDHLELPDAGNSLSEDYSSTTSYREDIEEGILAQPLPDYHLNSMPYEGHRSIVQQESMEEEVISHAQAPIPAAVLALPQMPNVYSESAGGSRVVTESRNAVETESRNVVRTEARNAPNQDRRVSMSSTMINEGRRVSLGGPMRLLVPRDASNDMAMQEFNNNDSSDGRISAVRRKSKSYYFDDMSLGGGSSQGRRMSQIFLQDGDDYGQSRRRVSVVRLNGSSDALAGTEPIQLKVLDDAGISYASPWEENQQESMSMRRVSLVSNRRLSGSRSDEMLDSIAHDRRSSWGERGKLKVMNDEYEDNPRRRRMSASSRRISIGANSLGAMSDSGYPSRRRMSNTQRVSVSTRKLSSANGSKTVFHNTGDKSYDYDDGAFVRGSTQRRRSSTAELLGYGSDSTDSGYAVTRRSKRYRRREESTMGTNKGRQTNGYKQTGGYFGRNNAYDINNSGGKKRRGYSTGSQNSGYKRNGEYHSQNDAYEIDDDQGQKLVQIQRKSVSRIANGGTTGTQRSSQLSPEYEMWSREHQAYRNNGYESDSYV